MIENTEVTYQDINLRDQRGIVTKIETDKLVYVRWNRYDFDSLEYVPNLKIL